MFGKAQTPNGGGFYLCPQRPLGKTVPHQPSEVFSWVCPRRDCTAGPGVYRSADLMAPMGGNLALKT